eukprot:6584721-Pyramimonas_sp.AAC.1
MAHSTGELGIHFASGSVAWTAARCPSHMLPAVLNRQRLLRGLLPRYVGRLVPGFHHEEVFLLG